MDNHEGKDMNLIKFTIKDVSINNNETERRAKELMGQFGEVESEVRAVTRCSNILKFEGKLDDDYFMGNDATHTIELYVVMKEYENPIGNFNCRYEYHVHWIRNVMSEDGTYPQDDYTNFSGYSSYDSIIDTLQSANEQFEKFKEGKVEKLDFFGIILC